MTQTLTRDTAEADRATAGGPEPEQDPQTRPSREERVAEAVGAIDPSMAAIQARLSREHGIFVLRHYGGLDHMGG